MREHPWLIYGAYGYTGALLVGEAVRRGHRPLLAGRSRDKLLQLAEHFALPHAVVSLDDVVALKALVERAQLVVHAAGPFIHTAPRMLDACLATATHYTDITGEFPVLRMAYARHGDALRRGIAIMPAIGFDVVPSDCLLKYVATQQPTADTLEMAFAATAAPSGGTVKSVLEHLPSGGWVRRDGRLVAQRMGEGARKVRFTCGERLAVPIPWGDLESGYRSTGIGNITTYAAFPPATIRGLKMFARPLGFLLGAAPLRRLAQRLAGATGDGPDEATRKTARTYLWARASGPAGASEAWLETAEGYTFTARAGVSVVERLLASPMSGALTPSALGADFVLDIEGTRRFDSLS